MNEQEQWKDIEGYEGIYQVSSFGRVRSLDRVRPDKNGVMQPFKGKILGQYPLNGYNHVALMKNCQHRTTKVHRLVALAFVPGYFDGAEVNHKDENRLNNRADNLEWCDRKYNNNYGTRTEKATAHLRKIRKAVLQFDDNGNFIARYDSCYWAAKATGLRDFVIRRACGDGTRGGGFRWKFEKDMKTDNK